MIPDVAEQVSLAGKTAYVTGAAGGIGVSLCTYLAAAGADVVSTDVRESEGILSVGRAFPGRIAFRRFDLLSDDGLEDCARDVDATVPDILLNNVAGRLHCGAEAHAPDSGAGRTTSRSTAT